MIEVKFNKSDLLLKIAISLLLIVGVVYIIVDRYSDLKIFDISVIIVLLILILFSYRGLANETKNLTFKKEYFEFYRLFPLPGRNYKRAGKFMANEIDQIIVERTHGGGSRDFVKLKLKNGNSIQFSLPPNHQLFKKDVKKELENLEYLVLVNV